MYAHVPNVNGADGKKLSKRHGAVTVDEFRQAGYLPEALVNFLALLGWAPDGETTIMSRDELVERFTLERVGRSAATFDYDKLDWMNGVYLRALAPDAYADRLDRLPPRAGARLGRAADPCGGAARAGEDRASSASSPSSPASSSTTSSPIRPCSTAASLSAAAEALEHVEPFTAEQIEPALKELCERLGLKPRQAFQPIRVAVTGSKISPGLYESLELLGREESLARIRRAAAVAA